MLVTEYISDMVSLHDLQDREVVSSSVTAWHVKDLDDIFGRMNKAGVTHEDVGSRNMWCGRC